MDFRNHMFRYRELEDSIKVSYKPNNFNNDYSFVVGTKIFDMTRDEYVEFRYQWSQLEGDIGFAAFSENDWLCILNLAAGDQWSFIPNDYPLSPHKIYPPQAQSFSPKPTPLQNFPSAPQVPPPPKRLCECGAWKLGTSDYNRSHSAWCPSFNP